MTSIKVRVFALFSLGYFVSFLFRGVNLGFSPFLVHDLGLSTTDLGTLTSLYFLGFAAAQIPGGVLLDHFGARRVIALVMLIAAIGIYLFGNAHSLAAMMAGRLLIGVGVSVCLGGAFKATAQHFPLNQLTLINGLVMAVGGMGGVVVGAPLSWLLSITDWRTVCDGLAILTVVVAGSIWLFAPAAAVTQRQARVLDQFIGTWHVFRSRAFWKIATFSALTQGVFYAIQSLWIGTFLRDVLPAGQGNAQANALISVLGLAFIGGNIAFGALARLFERRGVTVLRFSGVLMVLFVLVQVSIAARVALPEWALWAAYGAFGSAGILTYSALAEHFPARLVGRVNTTFTLLIFLAIFILQSLIGRALGHWVTHDGHFPVIAHQTVWAVLILLQLAAAAWYFIPARRLQVLPAKDEVA